MAGVKIVSEEVEKDVTLLQDVDPEFVSLVRHGANRMPFRVVKKEKEGGERMGLYIQSLLLSKGTKFDKITEIPELAYLSEAKTDQVQRFEGYDKYTQLDESKFVPETFKLVKVAEDAWALAGDLAAGITPEDALMVSEETARKAAELPVPPMDTVIGDTAEARRASVIMSFGEHLHKEVDSMLSIVFGALKQAAADPARRKKVVLGAVDAFRNFLSVGLDVVGEAAAKIERPDISGKIGGINMLEFKDEKEFSEAVGKVVSAVLKERDEKAREEAEKARAEEEKKAEEKRIAEAKKTLVEAEKGKEQADVYEKIGSLTQSIEKISNTVDSLAKKQEELENSIDGEPAGNTTDGAGDDPPTKKGDGVDDNTDGKQKSVFRGLLTAVK